MLYFTTEQFNLNGKVKYRSLVFCEELSIRKCFILRLRMNRIPYLQNSFSQKFCLFDSKQEIINHANTMTKMLHATKAQPIKAHYKIVQVAKTKRDWLNNATGKDIIPSYKLIVYFPKYPSLLERRVPVEAVVNAFIQKPNVGYVLTYNLGIASRSSVYNITYSAPKQAKTYLLSKLAKARLL